MARYAIGDVQGCYEELRLLLEHISFDPASDELWFTGDLVNRGPKSLEVLRFVKALGPRAITVLGNHDLHLLAVAQGRRRAHRSDTLQEVLVATDREELLLWLRGRPLLHHDPDLEVTLIHAGLPPQWDLEQARCCAAEVEYCLRSDASGEFFQHMYGDGPAIWSNGLVGWDRLRFITNCLTRLRYCDLQGSLHLHEKGPPGSQTAGLVPWFEVPTRRSQQATLLFGHWSSLRLSRAAMVRYRVYPLDTSCCWGGELTALRVQERRLFSVPALRHKKTPPGSGVKVVEGLV